MFIPRHPVVENQFCQYDSQTVTGSAGIGGVVCYAGSVLYLDSLATNQESIVKKITHGIAATDVPIGLSMQKVKTGYHQVHPAGYSMPGDLGSSDVTAQPSYDTNGNITGTKAAPIGVAHLGIWDTVHYTCEMTTSVVDVAMLPGAALRPASDEAKLTNNVTDASSGPAPDATDKANGSYVTNAAVTVARVVKGASVAKCQANFNNTTLYPIRVKLLI